MTFKRLLTIAALAISVFYVAAQTGTKFTGLASYYANRLHGRLTSSGEKYDKDDYTCAHLKLPFGTRLRVTCIKSGKSVIVRVTDRGPYSKRFILDLSGAAARELDMLTAGVIKIEAEILPQYEEFTIEPLDILPPDYFDMFCLEQHSEKLANELFWDSSFMDSIRQKKTK